MGMRIHLKLTRMHRTVLLAVGITANLTFRKVLAIHSRTAVAIFAIHFHIAKSANLIMLIIVVVPKPTAEWFMSFALPIVDRTTIGNAGCCVGTIVIRPIVRMLRLCFFRMHEKRATNADASHQHNNECGSQKFFHGDSLSFW